MSAITNVQFENEPLPSVDEKDLYKELIEQFHEVAMERYGSKSEQVRTSAWLLGKDVY
jgi:hypothetical protein